MATSRARAEHPAEDDRPQGAPLSKSARRRRRRQRAARARAEREAGEAKAGANGNGNHESPRAGSRDAAHGKPARKSAPTPPPRTAAERPAPRAKASVGEREAAARPRSAPAAQPRAPRSEKVVEFPVEARRQTPAPEPVGDDVLLFRVRNTGPCTRFLLKEAFD